MSTYSPDDNGLFVIEWKEALDSLYKITVVFVGEGMTISQYISITEKASGVVMVKCIKVEDPLLIKNQTDQGEWDTIQDAFKDPQDGIINDKE